VLGVRRKYYDRLEGAQKSKINQEQVETLNAWGFDWMTRDTMNLISAPRNRTDWNEVRRWICKDLAESFVLFSYFCISFRQRYEQLCAYKEQHGHVNVPQAIKPLGEWLHTQRKLYSQFVRGKRKTYDQWKIDKLNALGMVWLTRKRPNTSDAAKKKAAKKAKKTADTADPSSSSSDEEEEEAQNGGGRSTQRSQPSALQRLLNPWERYH
jgi:hypothetical protein